MVRVRCPKCGHEWETKSKLAYITCPNCLRKVRVTATTTATTTTTPTTPPSPPTPTTLMLSVGELAALLGDVESVALINGVPVSFGAEAERRGFIAYQLAAPRVDDSAWIVVKGSFADYVLHVWTALNKVAKEEVLEAAKRFVKRGLRRDVRKLAAEGEDEAALIALFVLTEKGMVDWSSGAPAPVIR